MPNTDRPVETIKLAKLAPARDGSKFTKAEREANRTKIAEFRLKGLTFDRIAAELGISTHYAYSEYKVVEDRWRATAHQSVMQLKQRELARLDLVESEAWAAYERSRADAVEIQQEYVPGQSEDEPEKVMTGTKAKRKGRDGDARFLAVVLDCIDRRIKLLGLDREDLQRAASGNTSNNGGTPGQVIDRISKYQSVLGVAIVAVENRASGDADSGESVDSARSALEAGGVLDVDGRVRDTTP